MNEHHRLIVRSQRLRKMFPKKWRVRFDGSKYQVRSGESKLDRKARMMRIPVLMQLKPGRKQRKLGRMAVSQLIA